MVDTDFIVEYAIEAVDNYAVNDTVHAETPGTTAHEIR